MSRAGVNSDHAELCLGHVMPGIRAIYDRHSYMDEKARGIREAGRSRQGYRSMTRILVLLATLLSPSVAHAERWCNGILTSNNVCEVSVQPVIVRCNYYDSNSDPGCVGVGVRHPTVERRTTKSTSPR